MLLYVVSVGVGKGTWAGLLTDLSDLGIAMVEEFHQLQSQT